MGDWANVLAIAAAAASALFGIEYLVTTVRALRDLLKARQVRRVRFDTAAAEADVFDSLKRRFATVGSLSLEEYSSSASARASLDAFLLRAKSFLDSPPEPAAVEKSLAGLSSTASEHTSMDEIPGQTSEDVWNTLAKTRMQMEKRLREIAGSKDMIVYDREPMSRLLRRMMEGHVLPRSAYKDLLLFYTVASSAIHGSNVSQDLANRALASYSRGMDILEAEVRTLADELRDAFGRPPSHG